MTRFGPTGSTVLAVQGEIASGEGFERVGRSPSTRIKARDVIDLFHEGPDFGHYLAMAYGD